MNYWTGEGGGGEGVVYSDTYAHITINFNKPTKSVLVLEAKGSFVLLFHSHTSLSERDHIDHDTFYYFFFQVFFEAETTKSLK